MKRSDKKRKRENRRKAKVVGPVPTKRVKRGIRRRINVVEMITVQFISGVQQALRQLAEASEIHAEVLKILAETVVREHRKCLESGETILPEGDLECLEDFLTPPEAHTSEEQPTTDGEESGTEPELPAGGEPTPQPAE